MSHKDIPLEGHIDKDDLIMKEYNKINQMLQEKDKKIQQKSVVDTTYTGNRSKFNRLIQSNGFNAHGVRPVV